MADFSLICSVTPAADCEVSVNMAECVTSCSEVTHVAIPPNSRHCHASLGGLERFVLQKWFKVPHCFPKFCRKLFCILAGLQHFRKVEEYGRKMLFCFARRVLYTQNRVNEGMTTPMLEQKFLRVYPDYGKS